MAFISKVGNLLKKNAANQLSPFLFQGVRCMSSSKLFVGGLSYNTDDMSLKEAFTTYGEVIETKVVIDRETGRSRGFGFISFTSSDEATSAMQAMDGQDLHGRRVTVNYATERGGGFRSEGGYGNNGGYNSGYNGGYGGNDSNSYGSGGGGSYGGTGGVAGGDNNYTSGGSNNYGSGGSYGASGNGTFGIAGDVSGGVAVAGDNSYASGGTNSYGNGVNTGVYSENGDGAYSSSTNSGNATAGADMFSTDRFVGGNGPSTGNDNQYNSDVGGSMGAGGLAHGNPLEGTYK